jgi:PPOX class F420-dependent enzyme/OxyR family protein
MAVASAARRLRSNRPRRIRGDAGEAAAEARAFGWRQHVGEAGEFGRKLTVKGGRRVRPAGRERDGQRAPVAGHGGPRDQAAAFGPVGQAGERGLLDAEQAGQAKVALVIDDLVSTSPWTPRFLRVYGTAELIERPGQFGSGAYMRITPDTSWSWNLAGRPYGEGALQSGPRRTVHRSGQ